MSHIKVIKSVLPEKALVAISMGVDSFAAFYYLRSHNYHPIHFNHNQRPQNHKMEEAFRKYFRGSIQKAHCQLSTEKAMRDSRIAFYREQCRKHGVSTVITAHHQDDWIESYLMNCFRGQPDRVPIPLVTDFDDFQIIHPFLLTSKESLHQYAFRNNLLKWVVEDESNQVTKGSRRNWVRSVITPALEEAQISLRKFATRQVQKEIYGH